MTTLLLAALFATQTQVTDMGGLGDWRFGMTKEQIRATTTCSPWKDVPITGGLECPNFEFAGKKRNVSFVFDGSGALAKIQLWFCEAADRKAAGAAVDELLAFMTKTWGDLESGNVPKVGRDALLDALDAAAKAPHGPPQAKVQLKPVKEPNDVFVFASVFRDPTHGYYCFLYYQPAQRAG